MIPKQDMLTLQVCVKISTSVPYASVNTIPLQHSCNHYYETIQARHIIIYHNPCWIE